MTEQQALSPFWEQQASIMSRRPRGWPAGVRETEAGTQGQLTLPNSAQATPPAGEGESLSLEQQREKIDRIGAWLLANDLAHPRWEQGLRTYCRLSQELQQQLDGVWHYLRQPGDEYRDTLAFPADTSLPFITGTWQRLSDGRIEARVSLFELRVMREMRNILAGE